MSKKLKRAKNQPGILAINKNHSPGWPGIIVIIIFALIPFIAGKYLEFSQSDPFDSSLSIYHARAIQADRFYDEPISALPATLLVNFLGVAIFGYSEVGPIFFQMILQIAALGLMFYTLYRLFGLWPAGLALFLASAYLSHPLIAKGGNVKEQFMIGCMLLAVCAFVLRHLDDKRWWLMVCGVFAVNIYYFKPTGASAIIALIIYLIISVICRWQKIKDWALDIFWIIAGANVGLLPLLAFHYWRGMLWRFINNFPTNIVLSFIPVIIVGLGLWLAYKLWQKKHLYAEKIIIDKRIKIWGIRAVALTLFFAGAYFIYKGDLWGFVKNIWPIAGLRYLSGLIPSLRIGQLAGEYLAGSRAIADLPGQVFGVMNYYVHFATTIALALVAIGWAMAKAVVNLKSKDLPEDENDPYAIRQQHRLIEKMMILWSLWFLMDMAFIWVSPRNYVQYYLPMNASGAFLIAYVLYCCRSWPLGYVILIAAVWLIDPLLTAIAYGIGGPGEVGLFPGGYWPGQLIKFIPVIAALVILYLTAKKPVGRRILLAGNLALMILMVNTVSMGTEAQADVKNIYRQSNLTQYQNRIELTQANKNASFPWHSVGDYIKANSTEADYIYVWGWYPGVYVRAERLCSPGVVAAESNMHTDSPQYIAWKIRRNLNGLDANKPLFIVDAQHRHFPYYSPIFDLWPISAQGVFMPAEQLDDFVDVLSENVYRRMLAVLTHPQRPGGPMAKERAEELARLEQQRHQEMLPLRRFVMENYQPVSGNFGNMKVYRRK